MTTPADLLREIVARPDDDLLRLMFADALEDEGGDPARSEFVRVQIELSMWGNEQARPRAYGNWHVDCRHNACGMDNFCNTPPTTHGRVPCEYHALRKRERELLGSNWHAWRGAALNVGMFLFCENLFPAPPCPNPHITFRRGFVEAITLSAEDWLAHGDAVLAAQPVTEVTLTSRPAGGYLAWRHQEGCYCIRLEAGAASREVFVREVPMPRMFEATSFMSDRTQYQRVHDLPPLEDVLKAAWPRVRTWHLPEPAVVREQFVRDQVSWDALQPVPLDPRWLVRGPF